MENEWKTIEIYNGYHIQSNNQKNEGLRLEPPLPSAENGRYKTIEEAIKAIDSEFYIF